MFARTNSGRNDSPSPTEILFVGSGLDDSSRIFCRPSFLLIGVGKPTRTPEDFARYPVAGSSFEQKPHIS